MQAMFEDWQRARLYYDRYGEDLDADGVYTGDKQGLYKFRYGDKLNAKGKYVGQRCKSLAINIPPGCSKSRIVSVAFIAWVWLHDPTWRVLCLSANPEVAIRDSTYCRNLVDSDWYRTTFNIQWTLAGDQNTKTKFRNTMGGERLAKGITATIVGTRADAILIDDPNDAKKIHSETSRQGVIDALDQAIGNRLNDMRCGLKILIQQRLHELDLTGHVLRQGWESLCLPMEFEIDRRCTTALGFTDPRTVEGELLHAVRFPRDVLADERIRLGSYGYAGQMQQRPSPAGGGIFKRDWWGWFKHDGVALARHRPNGTRSREEYPAIVLPKLEWLLISIDAAFKGATTSDRVGMLVIGGCKADRFVLDDRTRIRTFTETIKSLIQVQADHPKARKFLIEDAANGAAIVDTLGSDIAGMISVKPEGGKESRAHAASPQVESGNVYLLDGSTWAEDFCAEHDSFPNGRYDDRVDALTQALIHMTRSPAAARAARLLGL